MLSTIRRLRLLVAAYSLVDLKVDEQNVKTWGALVGKNELRVGDQLNPPFASRVDLSSNRRGFLRLKNFSEITGLGVHCWGSKLSFPPGRAGSLWLFSVQWAADRLNGDGAVREPPYACDACHYACPATTGRCAPVRCR